MPLQNGYRSAGQATRFNTVAAQRHPPTANPPPTHIHAGRPLFVFAPFVGGGEVGVDDGEFGEALQGAPAAAGGSLLDPGEILAANDEELMTVTTRACL